MKTNELTCVNKRGIVSSLVSRAHKRRIFSYYYYYGCLTFVDYVNTRGLIIIRRERNVQNCILPWMVQCSKVLSKFLMKKSFFLFNPQKNIYFLRMRMPKNGNNKVLLKICKRYSKFQLFSFRSFFVLLPAHTVYL